MAERYGLGSNALHSSVTSMPTPELSLSLSHALLELAADGIVVTDERGTIVLASAAAASLLGWPRDELVGTDVALVLGEPLEGGRVLTGRRRDGSTLAIEVTTSEVETPQGRLLLAELHDASERRGYVDGLERSEAWLRELIEQAPDGILVIGHDGRYVEANASICRLLGYSRDELVGKAPIDIADPEHAPRLAEIRARVAAAGGATELLRWTFVHKDGTRVPTEVHARILADGRRQAFIRDIREQERVERELRAAEAERAAALRELAVAIDQCPAGIAILRGPEGQHVTHNRAARALWGDRLDASAGLRQPRSIVCRPDGTPLTREELPAVRALREGRIVRDRVALRMPDGALVPYDISVAPLFDEHGAVSGAIAIAWDVSAVVELERLRAEWSSLIAHDLRQPIHAISLFAQMARRHARSGPEMVPRDIASLLEVVERLKLMTDDLLDFSRIEAKRLTIEWTSVDLVACTRAAMDRVALVDPELRVELRVDGEIPPLAGEPQRLAQVMDRLLGIARGHRRPDSSVRVHIERDGEHVAVAVTHEGDGIDPADLPRLFERLERPGTVRTSASDVGLGMQILRGLVEAHGGRIAAESIPGGETTFRFRLPLVRPAEARLPQNSIGRG